MPNPVVLDANGQAAIRLQGRAYKLDLFDASDVRQALWPVDNVQADSVAGGLLLASTTLTAVNGTAALTAAALIPAGARVLAVTTRITQTFGTSGGLTSLGIGDGAIMDRWGVQTSLSANAQTSGADFHGGDLPLYPTATAVVVSALGGLFDTAGALEVAVQYLLHTHRMA